MHFLEHPLLQFTLRYALYEKRKKNKFDQRSIRLGVLLLGRANKFYTFVNLSVALPFVANIKGFKRRKTWKFFKSFTIQGHVCEKGSQ